jgi:hypothetical protein
MLSWIPLLLVAFLAPESLAVRDQQIKSSLNPFQTSPAHKTLESRAAELLQYRVIAVRGYLQAIEEDSVLMTTGEKDSQELIDAPFLRLYYKSQFTGTMFLPHLETGLSTDTSNLTFHQLHDRLSREVSLLDRLQHLSAAILDWTLIRNPYVHFEVIEMPDGYWKQYVKKTWKFLQFGRKQVKWLKDYDA